MTEPRVLLYRALTSQIRSAKRLSGSFFSPWFTLTHSSIYAESLQHYNLQGLLQGVRATLLGEQVPRQQSLTASDAHKSVNL
jgi:hypothetical protein